MIAAGLFYSVAPAATYDSARRQTILYGGHGSSIYGDTWAWNGTSWTQLSPPASPPAREGHNMAFDISRAKIVEFGGNDGTYLSSQTWEWDGTTWVWQMTPTSPTARRGAPMAYGQVRHKIILFGGYDNTTQWDTTWEYPGP